MSQVAAARRLIMRSMADSYLPGPFLGISGSARKGPTKNAAVAVEESCGAGGTRGPEAAGGAHSHQLRRICRCFPSPGCRCRSFQLNAVQRWCRIPCDTESRASCPAACPNHLEIPTRLCPPDQFLQKLCGPGPGQ